MATIAFDTLKFSKRLKDAGVPEKQAEAEAEALAEVLEVNLKELATQRDIGLLAKDMEQMEQRTIARFDARIAESKAELIRWIVGVGVLQIALIAALVLKLLPS